MLNIKDKRTNGVVCSKDLPIGAVYEDRNGLICIKVADNLVFYNNEDGVWELIDVNNEDALPLDAELVIKGRK